MTPETMLHHLDSGQHWPAPLSQDPSFDLAAAYRCALAVRQHRQARGESPRGYKIGFTNRTIWPLYQVFAPIWGTVWDSTLQHCEGEGTLSLACTCQPRLEPEIVFGMKATPPLDATLDDLFDAIDWMAPGFEVVQSHLPDWKFKAADTVADSGLHARLLVGFRQPVRAFACDAAELDTQLAQASVTLSRNGEVVERGYGHNVLDSPLRALHHFLDELRACPDAPDLQTGDVVTTGTWTDAWPMEPEQRWDATFSLPGMTLGLRTTA